MVTRVSVSLKKIISTHLLLKSTLVEFFSKKKYMPAAIQAQIGAFSDILLKKV